LAGLVFEYVHMSVRKNGNQRVGIYKSNL
jgi:hypothetical protein